MVVLYNIFVFLYYLGIRVASLFNNKAKLWIQGRKNLFKNLRNDIRSHQKIVWFHAASLGEFEQGRPVLEEFKKIYPDYKILLTFFSPSGYEIRKNYKVADFIYYLPIDMKKNVNLFLKIVKPQFVFFIKYEFWFNYLNKLYESKIPVFIVSANFREGQYFFKWYGEWFRKNLRKITWFFVQNQNSIDLLKSIGINNASVSGDTRFDRVVEIAGNPKKFPLVEKFVQNKFVILAGSTWPEDEKILAEFLSNINSGIRLIIAPHEIHETHIVQIEKILANYKPVRLSKAKLSDIAEFEVLIIDGMGFLSSLYQYCQLAYIGGGFGKGIHNILEAVTFGKPVIFGPNFQKFAEAVELVKKGGAFTFEEQGELLSLMKTFKDDTAYYLKSSESCKTYIENNKGATEKILRKFSSFISKQ